MAPFYGWGSTASRLQPLRGGSLLFTIQDKAILSKKYLLMHSSFTLQMRNTLSSTLSNLFGLQNTKWKIT